VWACQTHGIHTYEKFYRQKLHCSLPLPFFFNFFFKIQTEYRMSYRISCLSLMIQDKCQIDFCHVRDICPINVKTDWRVWVCMCRFAIISRLQCALVHETVSHPKFAIFRLETVVLCVKFYPNSQFPVWRQWLKFKTNSQFSD
jgi:hypothetical protein